MLCSVKPKCKPGLGNEELGSVTLDLYFKSAFPQAGDVAS